MEDQIISQRLLESDEVCVETTPHHDRNWAFFKTAFSSGYGCSSDATRALRLLPDFDDLRVDFPSGAR